MYFRSRVWIPYKSGFYPDYACFAWSLSSFSCIRSAWICKDRYIWRVTARACCCCFLTSGDDDVQEVLESLHRAVCLSSLFLFLKAWICKDHVSEEWRQGLHAAAFSSLQMTTVKKCQSHCTGLSVCLRCCFLWKLGSAKIHVSEEWRQDCSCCLPTVSMLDPGCLHWWRGGGGFIFMRCLDERNNGRDAEARWKPWEMKGGRAWRPTCLQFNERASSSLSHWIADKEALMVNLSSKDRELASSSSGWSDPEQFWHPFYFDFTVGAWHSLQKHLHVANRYLPTSSWLCFLVILHTVFSFCVVDPYLLLFISNQILYSLLSRLFFLITFTCIWSHVSFVMLPLVLLCLTIDKNLLHPEQ
jgi:hypothetical protein